MWLAGEGPWVYLGQNLKKKIDTIFQTYIKIPEHVRQIDEVNIMKRKVKEHKRQWNLKNWNEILKKWNVFYRNKVLLY